MRAASRSRAISNNDQCAEDPPARASDAWRATSSTASSSAFNSSQGTVNDRADDPDGEHIADRDRRLCGS